MSNAFGRHIKTGASVIALGWLNSACSFTALSNSDVHYGEGVGITTHWRERQEAGRPVGTLRIDDSTIGELREQLQAFLGGPEDPRYHFAFALNEPRVWGCASGGVVGPCMIMNQVAPNLSQIFGFFPPSLDGIKSDERYFTGLSWLSWNSYAAPVAVTPDVRQILGALGLNRKGVLMRGRIDASSLTVGRVNHGAAGLTAALTLTPSENLSGNGSCSGAGKGSGVLTDQACKAISKALKIDAKRKVEDLLDCSLVDFECEVKLDLATRIEGLYASCAQVSVNVDLNRLRYNLGLVPTIAPECDPLALRKDKHGYAASFEGADPASFNQGCLDVASAVEWISNVDVDGRKQGDNDLEVTVDLCPQAYVVAHLWDAALWPAILLGQAPEFIDLLLDYIESGIRDGLRPSMRALVEKDLKRLEYQGGKIVVPQAPATVLVPGKAQTYLNASLSRAAYGWFANAFSDGRDPAENRVGYAVKAIRDFDHCEVGRYVEDIDPDNWLALVAIYTLLDPGLLREWRDLDAAGGLCVEGSQGSSKLYRPIGPANPGTFIDFDYIIDRDRDDVDDPVDNCPFSSNEDQSDTDDDGIGNRCDTCPYDFNNDIDGDGVCAISEVSGDNCPLVPNPTQANCNEESEWAEGGEILGDACDPVPCPLFSTIKKGLYQSSNLILNVQVVEVTDIVHTPIGAHSRKGGAEVPVQVERSLYRYCIDDPDNFVRCASDDQTNFELAEPEGVVSRFDERRGTTWHRITLGSNGTGQVGQLTYSAGTRDSRPWDWRRDFSDWRGSALINTGDWLPDPNVVLNAQQIPPFPEWNLTGRLWILGDTGVGAADPAATTSPRADWIHTLASGTEFPSNRSRAISSHYEVLSPLEVRATVHRAPSEINVAVVHCRYCPEALDVPSPETCPVCGLPGSARDDIRILTQIRGSEELAWLGSDGSLYPAVVEEVSDELAHKLSQSGWISASEPNPQMGVGLTSPAAIQVSANGTQVVERLYTVGERLVSEAELAALRLQVGGDGPPRVARSFSAASDPPVARSGALLSYSRARAQLAVIAGWLEDGSRSGDVWIHDLRTESWTRLTGVELGSVRAATWTRHGLAMLDVVGRGWARRMRLVLADPETQLVETLAEWPYLGLFNKQYLGMDQDGELILASSSRLLRTHAIARIVVAAGEPALAGFRLGQGELGGAPLVDVGGYTLVTTDRQGRLVPSRHERLFATAGSWHDLGRCF